MPEHEDVSDDTRRVLEYFSTVFNIGETCFGEQYEALETDRLLTRAALLHMSHDCLCLARSAVDVCGIGWSPTAALALRALLEVYAGAIAICRSASPELAAFKYMFAGVREMTRDAYFSSEYRRNLRALLKKRSDQLAPQDRPGAATFLKDKRREFWYAPEFQSPRGILEAHASEGLALGYEALSAAAHGGFIGLRLFRDEPDEYDARPRRPGKSADTVAAMSARMLVEQVLHSARALRLPSAYLAATAMRIGYREVGRMTVERALAGPWIENLAGSSKDIVERQRAAKARREELRRSAEAATEHGGGS